MKKQGLYKKMLNNAVVPILILGIAVTFLCYFRFTNTIYEQAKFDMINVAKAVMSSYDIEFPGDYHIKYRDDSTFDLYKGDAKITDVYEIVDQFADLSLSELSLIYMDMRVNTTFGRKTGKRLAGVSTNKHTSEQVLNEGEIAFYTNVPIDGHDYLVLYVPVENSDGSIVGMVEIARTVATMRRAVAKAVWPVMLVSLGGMAIAVFFSYRSTKEITSVLKKVQQFMNKVSGGNLQAELESSVLNRTDELGDISKSATAMQRSIRSFVETDPLTKLGNRRYINQQLEKIRDKARTSGLPYSLAIADIDFFKKVNDTYGHNAGDEVLKAVANVLKKSMQGKGFAGRWGGEEFILVFDKSGMYEAADHLWRVLEEIRAMVVSTEGFDIRVTMTFGVVDGTQSSIEEMVEGADEKLYYGKQNGRNRVVTEIENEEPEPEPEKE